MNPSPEEMRILVAKMLPDEIEIYREGLRDAAAPYPQEPCTIFVWKHNGTEIRESEWLFVAHLAEKTLSKTYYSYKFGLGTYSSSQESDYYQLLMFGNQPSFLSDGCGKYEDMPKAPDALPHLNGGINATASQRIEALCRVKHPNLFETK